MSILDSLNPEQREAAAQIDGPVLILAGAGSGKTRTLTYRIAHMINEQGISPYKILAVTFTNKAAREMRERVVDLIGADGEKTLLSTFHSFGVRMLRIHGSKVGYQSNFNIYDTDDQKRLVKAIMKEENIDKDSVKPGRVVSKISKLKEEGIFPREFADIAENYYDSLILKIYERYQKSLRENNALDFSDILVYTNELLDSKEVLNEIQDRYRYIMVDEYQDTNKIQYEIVSKIANKHRNICVVGDEDQSIYGFRGADIRNILNFEKDYSDAKVVKLERNYRSTQVILEAANSVISHNTTSKGKKLWTDIKDGELIRVYEAENSRDEAIYVGKEVKKLLETGKSYKDITVLYRMNSQSRSFEEYFLNNGIPYKIYGGLQFYQRKEIKDIFAYLNVINNNADSLSLQRILNVPVRGIGAKTVEKLQEIRENMNVPLYYVLKNIDSISEISSRAKNTLKELYQTFEELIAMSKEKTVSDLVNEVLKKTLYLEKLKLSNDNEGRVENIYELQNSIYDLEKQGGDIMLSEYLENISLSASTDDLEESENFVKMMTIHSSKGLEFPVVFVVGFEDEIFPGEDIEPKSYEEEEERRLCYVAITRAKQVLYLIHSRERTVYGRTSYMREVSRFISEMPRKNLKYETMYMDPVGYKNTSVKRGIDFFKKPEKVKSEKVVDCAYSIGEFVTHKKFGEGKIKNLEKDKMVIYFKAYGEKKFPISIIEKFLSKN